MWNQGYQVALSPEIIIGKSYKSGGKEEEKSDDDSDIEDGPDDDGVHYTDRVGVRIKTKHPVS